MHVCTIIPLVDSLVTDAASGGIQLPQRPRLIYVVVHIGIASPERWNNRGHLPFALEIKISNSLPHNLDAWHDLDRGWTAYSLILKLKAAAFGRRQYIFSDQEAVNKLEYYITVTLLNQLGPPLSVRFFHRYINSKGDLLIDLIKEQHLPKCLPPLSIRHDYISFFYEAIQYCRTDCPPIHTSRE